MLAQPNSLLTHLSGLDGKLEPLYSAPSTKQGRAPGSITAGSDGGSLLRCPYQTPCSLPARRVLARFKKSVLCSRVNHLYAELSQS